MVNFYFFNKIGVKFCQFFSAKRKTFSFKFALMAFLMFFILLNQNIVRMIKDSLIVTLIGPEILSFIKLGCEIPASILFVLLYSKMCNKMKSEKVFQTIVSGFLIFFTVFIFFIFPMREIFHPKAHLVNHLIHSYPNFKFFILMWGKWTLILFYVVSSLWPVIVFSLLFWQLMNQITSIPEAFRLYPTLNLFGQLSALFSGGIIFYFSSHENFLSKFFHFIFKDSSVLMLNSLALLALGTGGMILLLLKAIERYMRQFNLHSQEAKNVKKLLKMNLSESLKWILSSKQIGLIAALVISYSFSVSLIEGIWLAKVSEQYPKADQLIRYQGKVLFYTGAFAGICAMIGNYVIRSLGWLYGALATPIASLIIGSAFFFLIYFENQLEAFLTPHLTLTPVMLIVITGSLENIVIKSIKYSFFDVTKEMAYIPLEEELKTKGKATVELLGASLGKFLGFFFQMILFTFLPTASYSDLVFPLVTVFISICLLWTWSVIKLNQSFKSQTQVE